jgi:hypothetical protein
MRIVPRMVMLLTIVKDDNTTKMKKRFHIYGHQNLILNGAENQYIFSFLSCIASRFDDMMFCHLYILSELHPLRVLLSALLYFFNIYIYILIPEPA